MPHNIALAIVSGTISLLLAGCLPELPTGGGAGSGLSGGGNTPEAVAQAAEAARHSRNWRAFAECYTQASVENMILMNLDSTKGMYDFTLGNPDELRPLQPLIDAFRKHGIDLAAVPTPEGVTPEQRQLSRQPLVAQIVDKPGCFADLTVAGEAVEDAARQPGSTVVTSEPTNVSLQNVQISGDTATALSVSQMAGQTYQVPIHFRRENGVWKIDGLTMLQGFQ